MYLSTLSILLPTFFGAVFFKSLSRPIKILVFFIFTGVIFEGVTAAFFFFKMNNMVIFHLFTIFEFLFISAIYYCLFNNPILKKIVILLFAGFFAYSTIDIFYSGDINLLNGINRVIESGILMIYFFGYLYSSLVESHVPFVERNPYFILTIGFLIYFIGTVLLFFFSNNIIKSNIISAWTIHSILNIFLNVIYTVTIWRCSKVQ